MQATPQGDQTTPRKPKKRAPRAELESSITKKILAYLNEQPYTYALKAHGGMYGTGGQPDITCVCCGRAVMLEVKRPGEEPTERQKKRMRDWHTAGALVAVVFSVDDVKALLGKAPAGTHEPVECPVCQWPCEGMIGLVYHSRIALGHIELAKGLNGALR